MKRLMVTLKRSAVSRPKGQQDTVRGLGLRKIGDTRLLVNTPAVRGMVKKVLHLVDVQESEQA